MRKKPVIAVLCDFPVWYVDPSTPRKGWHYAVWLGSMYEGFKKQDRYEIHWVTFSRGVWLRRDFECGGQFFHVLPCLPLSLAAKLGYAAERLSVRWLFKRLRPDLVHAWGTENRYAVSGVVAGCKKMLSMQGVLSAIHRLCPLGDYMRRQAAMEPALLPQYDLVTSESQWGCERCREIAPQTLIRRWEYAPEQRFFRVERRLADTPTCLMAGYDSPIKNVDMVLRAFSSPELSHVRLLLAGISAEMRPGLPPNIVPLGGVDREGMTALLASAWCLVHPAVADTSPNIIKEARVVGLPVITSTECGGAQYVQQGESGYIMHSADEDAFKQAVLAVTADRETAEKMGRHGRETCRELLSEDYMLRRLSELYDAVLNDKLQTVS